MLFLMSAGVAYRVPARQLRLLGQNPIELPVPLSEFPREIGDWMGRELGILRASKSRIYVTLRSAGFSG